MLRTLRYGFLRNINKYFQRTSGINTICLSLSSKLLLASPVYCASRNTENRIKIDVENNLREACEQGDVAIMSLMDEIQDFVVAVCQEYRNCLLKQIEITEVATRTGPFSEVWDELPHYRTLEADLKMEIYNYMSVFNAIGQMAEDNSLVFFIKGNTDKVALITVKYKEIEALLHGEFAHNRMIELELLRVKRDSILKSVN